MFLRVSDPTTITGIIRTTKLDQNSSPTSDINRFAPVFDALEPADIYSKKKATFF